MMMMIQLTQYIRRHLNGTEVALFCLLLFYPRYFFFVFSLVSYSLTLVNYHSHSSTFPKKKRIEICSSFHFKASRSPTNSTWYFSSLHEILWKPTILEDFFSTNCSTKGENLRHGRTKPLPKQLSFGCHFFCTLDFILCFHILGSSLKCSGLYLSTEEKTVYKTYTSNACSLPQNSFSLLTKNSNRAMQSISWTWNQSLPSWCHSLNVNVLTTWLIESFATWDL